MSSLLFQPFQIGGLTLPNRFVRSATWDATADDVGAVTDKSVALYRKLGRGGIGLIITGHAFISPLGQAGHGQYGGYSDDLIPGLSRLAQAAHDGGAKIALQIAHSGITSAYLHNAGLTAQAVSAIPQVKRPHRETSDEDITVLVADFAAAAWRAVAAGFDAVQLHGAHGYLISQFLSPRFNHRTDRWGGSLENRRRFPLEVLKAVRQAVGDTFPVLIKLGTQDDRAGGLPVDEGIAAAQELAAAGIDAIEVSCGFGNSMQTLEAGEGEKTYFRDRAAQVKQAVKVPVMAVGGIRSLATAESIIERGDADLISMCRPFIREPGLIARWQRGKVTPARCISCNKCLGSAATGETLDCREEHPVGD